MKNTYLIKILNFNFFHFWPAKIDFNPLCGVSSYRMAPGGIDNHRGGGGVDQLTTVIEICQCVAGCLVSGGIVCELKRGNLAILMTMISHIERSLF